MSIAEQALFLLDLKPNKTKQKRIDHFQDLSSLVDASIFGTEPVQEEQKIETPNSFSVASRLQRPDYEDQARVEALMSAIRKIRANHVGKNSSRIIRRT